MTDLALYSDHQMYGAEKERGKKVKILHIMKRGHLHLAKHLLNRLIDFTRILVGVLS